MPAVRRTLAAAPLLLALAASTLPARGDDAKKDNAEAKEATKDAAPAPASGKLTITLADGKTATCREQSAQSFLIRGNWFPRTNDAEKLKEGRKLLEQAIKYRTEKYGYFEGYGNPKANRHPPKYYAKSTSFMRRKTVS
ncbi:MAG: hypothetical protein J0I07_37335, partial [Myxococcales bacterium]|nr:hypothetical protein [Myxococcales bacterium]